MIDKEIWMQRGNCHGIDVAVDDLYDVSEQGQLEAIQLWCVDCPVRQQCLQYALDNNEVYGVWGGVSEDQRLEMRKKRKRAA